MASTTSAARQQFAIQSPIVPYFCPSRRGVTALPATANWYNPAGTFPHAPIDYAGSNVSNNGAVIQTAATQTWIVGSPPIDTAKITDGTTYTIIVGEKRLDVRNLGNYQTDDNEGYTSGWDHDVMRDTTIQPRPDSNNGEYGEVRFGSSHSGVFQVAFADGSVRSLNYSIDLTLFSRLGQRNDNKPVTLE